MALTPHAALNLLLPLAVALSATACTRPTLQTGSDCTLNSDCTEPLVCGLDRCRRQCVDSRDCGAGLLCLAIAVRGGGACQLPEEARCSLTSDCESGLVCRFGTCTTECAEDRDCTPGAHCDEEAGGARACVEPSVELCIYDSDCPTPLTCLPDRRCGFECAEDRDCDRPRVCVANLCQLPDGGEP